jgi:hypothetical protein
MSRTTVTRAALLGTLILAGCATPEPVRVRVVSDVNQVRDCKVIGTVSDNELQDLQKKASRLGGDTALMTPEREAKGGYFGLQKYVTADVYQCSASK